MSALRGKADMVCFTLRLRPLGPISQSPMAAQAADSKSRGLPIQKEFLRCVTTVSKTSGHDLRRLATSSPHETSEPSHAVSLRRKMLEWRFAFSPEPNLRLQTRWQLHVSASSGGRWKN